MNRLERWVYERVKNRPILKQRIVDAYHLALGLVPQPSLVTSLELAIRDGYFFGFHDKTPFSPDGSLLLTHRNLIGDRVVARGDEVEVGVFSGPRWTDYRPLATTAAWNWQLGSMLQWWGEEGSRIAYNVLVDGRPSAVVCSLEGDVLCEWPFPVVHASPDGSRACTYDFARVEHALPGYGIVLEAATGRHRESRFTVFDCMSGAPTYSISLEEAVAILPHPSMEGGFHFFHHALFSPDGRRLFFMHRWVDREERRWTRMFSVSPDGEELFLFPMDEMVSHVTWASPTEIFGYLRYPGEGDGYYLVEDRTGVARRYFGDVLDSDGHPTMDRSRGIVITDTYPDRFRNQRLVLCRTASGERVDLCRTHLPRRFVRELQVDLHPRLHPSADVVCFDSGHTGARSLVTMNFSSML